MTSERARLRRAQLIERVRIAEQRNAAVAAFEAEGTRRRLAALTNKTRSLAALYEKRSDARDGAELKGVSLLYHHLHSLQRTTSDQAQRAEGEADARMAELSVAQRRQERAATAHRDVQQAYWSRRAARELDMSRRTGTVLE